MKTNVAITNAGEDLYNIIQDGLLEVEKTNLDLIEGLDKSSLDEGLSKVDILVNCIATTLSSARTAEGDSLPEFLHSVVTESEDLSHVTITVKSKLRATNRITEKRTIMVDGDFVENVGELFTDTVFRMYYLACAEENVEALNARLEEIYEAEGIEKRFLFAVTTGTSRIVSIDDNTVVIKAQLEQALKIAGLALVADIGKEDSEFEVMCAADAREKLVAVMRTIQITPEILKKKIDLVEKLGGLHTKKFAHKLIREGYRKKAENLKDEKSGVGYVIKEVGDTEVFALVQKNEKGELVFVLSPFNTKENTAMDVSIKELTA